MPAAPKPVSTRGRYAGTTQETVTAPVKPLAAPMKQQALPLRNPMTAPVSNSRKLRKVSTTIRPTPLPMTPPAGFQKDENGLREMALRHISYEIKMLRELADALQGKGVGPRTLNNALLESFLIHYRNLYDFFYPEFPSRKRLPHDVAASDYLPNPKQWRKRRPDLDRKRVVENRERVNCLLAHLTLRRLKYKNRSWPDRKMANTIEALIEEFVKELPRGRRPWFRSVIARTRNVPQLQAA
ncbi:MAG: hypothetical protein DMG65_14460 [Candidatus Angelobacter sp. Gp1-AA117]|nr:MAG: hypothetical protein DMG65_14460 [Candidatus Angelobacter sp. Gp1-AA117]